MGWSRPVTLQELTLVKKFSEASYPDRRIIKVVAERRQVHPKEEGSDLETAGLDILERYAGRAMRATAKSGLYDLFVDVYFEGLDPEAGLFVVVTVTETDVDSILLEKPPRFPALLSWLGLRRK